MHLQSTLIITKSARTKFRLMQKHIVGPGETVHISMERKSVTAKSHLAKFRLQRKFSLTPLPAKSIVNDPFITIINLLEAGLVINKCADFVF